MAKMKTKEKPPVEKLDVGYKFEKLLVDSSNIGQFIIREDHRDVRPGQIKKIEGPLSSGVHFDESLALIRDNGSYIVCDGQHRILAIHNALKEGTLKSIYVPAKIYPEGTDYRELYSKLSVQIKESADDYLKKYLDEIPIYHWLNQAFPVSITVKVGNYSQLPFRRLMAAYLGIYQKEVAHRGTSKSSIKQVIRELKQLNQEDYDRLKDIAEFYVETFGTYDSSNSFYGLVGLTVFFRIYYDNRTRFNRSRMVKDFKTHILNNEMYRKLSRSASSVMVSDLYRAAISQLNRGRTKKYSFMTRERVFT